LQGIDTDDDCLFAGIEPDQTSDRVDADAPNHQFDKRFFELSLFPGQKKLPNGIVWNHGGARAAPADHAVIIIGDAYDLREVRNMVVAQAGWKSAPVRPLMMFPDDSQDILIHARVFGEERDAELTMLFKKRLVLSAAFLPFTNEV